MRTGPGLPAVWEFWSLSTGAPKPVVYTFFFSAIVLLLQDNFILTSTAGWCQDEQWHRTNTEFAFLLIHITSLTQLHSLYVFRQQFVVCLRMFACRTFLRC